MPAKITTVPDPNLCGTTKYPIQLVQSGNVFRTLQPLNNTQVTQIAKTLKLNRGVKDPQIVYEDKLNNRKLVYKIVCKEDVEAQKMQSKDIESTSESSEDEDDFGDIRNSNDIILDPHDVLKMTDPATILGKKRKRGRPTEFEKFFMPKPKKKHSSQLKEQFGFTMAQAQALESDIVDDKTIVEVEVKDENEEDDGEGVLSSSRTRSGRLSRPPRTIVPNLIPNTSVGSILDMPNLPPPPPPPGIFAIFLALNLDTCTNFFFLNQEMGHEKSSCDIFSRVKQVQKPSTRL